MSAVKKEQTYEAVTGWTPETEVIFGADVAMTRNGREITLHAPDASGHGRRVVGRYANTAAAWEALDNLDAPAAGASRAA